MVNPTESEGFIIRKAIHAANVWLLFAIVIGVISTPFDLWLHHESNLFDLLKAFFENGLLGFLGSFLLVLVLGWLPVFLLVGFFIWLNRLVSKRDYFK
ncbi:hypothetical protein [Lentilactobacillus buchneri]|uniref:hypothetical protein n=1 Tax=Lentilactobacillus buchneri TaxID=1581 RepID=UPI003467BA5B